MNTISSDVSGIADTVSAILGLSRKQVLSAVELLHDGNTLPFIARYRKEATGGLDETALRKIEDEFNRIKELNARRSTVLSTIQQQGALTDELRSRILACTDKVELEMLYLPYKPKRRTKATIAREAGLGPLADILLTQLRQGRTKNAILKPFINPENGIENADDAIGGAGHIVAETWLEDIHLRTWLFEQSASGKITAKVKRGKKESGKKFEMYFDFSEPIRRIASHRFLAIKRGESEGVLRVAVELDEEYFVRQLTRRLVTNRDFELHNEVRSIVASSFRTHFLPAISQHVLSELKEKSDQEAISVFASNIRELLLASPAGKKVTIGLDPGFRTGCKVAVVDATGKFLTSTNIYPTAPKNDIDGAAETLLQLIGKFNVELIAIGNGTASRETDAFVTRLIKQHQLDVVKVIVNESGASIYSASELAVEEYPDLDVTIRGAISIAHRLQDPLAELVKIDPKSIGVGQYQHDVNQTMLQKSLDREVQSCVNLVGVELNTASRQLLGYVAGIGLKLSEKIVQHRNTNGPFTSRKDLMSVPKLGKKAFQQAAGFLRVSGSPSPLDDSAVHPECYYLVEKMAESLNTQVVNLVGNEKMTTKLSPNDFVDDHFGELTVKDIISELAKPGRDPRQEFQTVKFDESINEISDLCEGLVLSGQVTNVTNFGAFVDIGVHQDGLVHISQLANRYVADPAEVVSVGEVVKVKVMQIDEAKNRIGLSMKEV